MDRLTESPQNQRVLRAAAVFGGLLLLTLAVNAPSLNGDFIYDDHLQVENNVWIRSLRLLPDYFERSTGFFQHPDQPGGNYYRPLHMAAYALIYAVAGRAAWAYHLANVLLAALVAWMLFRLLRHWIPTGPAFLAAALFTLHPLHVEAVAWIAALPELLSALLLLWTLELHLRDRWQDWHYLAGGVLALGAFLTRESALVLPVLALLLDRLLPERRDRWRVWLPRYATYAAAVSVYVLLRTRALGHVLGGSRGYPLTWPEIILNWIPVFWQYLSSLVWPGGFSGFHVFQPARTGWSAPVVGALLGVAIIGIPWYYAIRKNRLAWFWTAWMVVTLLPFLYFPALGENVFAERYAYLFTVGAAALLGLLAAGLLTQPDLRMRRIATAAAVALALLWGGMSFQRGFAWRNDETMYTQTLKQDPGAYHFVNLLATYYYQQGERDRAERTLRSLDEAFPGGRSGAGEPDYAAVQALGFEHRIFRQAFFESRMKLGSLLLEQNRPEEAAAVYEKLAAVFPQNAEIQEHLARSLEQTGHADQAAEAYRTAMGLEPRLAAAQEGWNRLRPGASDDAGRQADALCSEAYALVQQQQFAAAEKRLRRAAELDPTSGKPYHYLFNLYWLNGDVPRARQAIREALARDPNNPLYQYNEKALQNR